MTAMEYALRTVAVAPGRTIQIAHAVAPGTLITLCGTMAAPEPGSRWDETDPASRCEQCVRALEGLTAASGAPPSSVVRRVRARWGGLGLRIRVAILAGVGLVILGLAVVFSLGGGFTPDQNSAPYKNGFAYGHDLMNASNDVPSSCTQATTDDPASPDGKNFIAGCEAGYAARTP